MTQSIQHVRSARIGLGAAALLLALAAPAAHALDPAQWQAVAPMLQAAVECRERPDTTSAAWRALPHDEYGQVEPVVPPMPFTVFGLPVREVSVFIDESGEMGESYTAEFAVGAPAVRNAAKLSGGGDRTTQLGALALSNDRPATLTCTVAGRYDESGYAEP